jgi:RNA polymerase sigma-70 factor (ECF subfamily)
MTKGDGGNDAALVRRVLAGERELFGVLVERYRPEFARYAGSLCGDTDLAADAMQEAFIRAYNGLRGCRDPTKFKAWFFTILRNQCHNARGRRRVHMSLEAVDPPSAARTDERVTSTEIRQAVESALDVLTPEQREAFVMKHIEGRSYGEMAELLEVGEDALKMRVYRARDIVKEHLKEFL